jgi:glycosyltransferase involved in cell wall biosynthesis
MRDLDLDVLIVQRPHELFELAERWLGGRCPGVDMPTVYVEHNAPQGRINELRHPAADAADRRHLTIVHVTAFNELFWDCGSTPTVLIQHGVVDPGHRYSGDVNHAVAVINEPARRGRVTGTDLIDRLAREAPIDLFGMGTEDVGFGNLPQHELHDAMSRRRVYLHPYRWTSLGLSLIEAMHLGLPVVALATTEVPHAVPPDAGIVTNRVDELAVGLRRLLADPEEARVMGKAAREAALSRYGLSRFLADWDRLLGEVCR